MGSQVELQKQQNDGIRIKSQINPVLSTAEFPRISHACEMRPSSFVYFCRKEQIFLKVDVTYFGTTTSSVTRYSEPRMKSSLVDEVCHISGQ